MKAGFYDWMPFAHEAKAVLCITQASYTVLSARDIVDNRGRNLPGLFITVVIIKSFNHDNPSMTKLDN